MSLEKITERILEEARQEEQKILAEADKQAQAVLDSARQEADAIRKNAALKAESDARTAVERQVLAARLEGRKMELAARKKLIADSISTAVDQLTSLPDEDYVKLLAEMIGEYTAEGGEIVLSAGDRERIGSRLIQLLNEKENTSPVTLAEDTVETRGGLILRQGDIALNATFETIIDTYDNAVQKDAAEALFGQEG